MDAVLRNLAVEPTLNLNFPESQSPTAGLSIFDVDVNESDVRKKILSEEVPVWRTKCDNACEKHAVEIAKRNLLELETERTSSSQS